MKYTFLFVLSILFSLQTHAQAKAQNFALAACDYQKASFTVHGNCEMCKATIEGVAKASGAMKADWNMKNDLLTIEFDPKRVTLERIQRNIAAMGYDNERFRGNDEAYTRLPESCRYERKAKAE
jgi:periplasmic mercuric ion binding protein